MFTGIKDLDLEILKHVKDRNLLKICSINKKMWNLVCDDNFLRKRLLKYPNIEQYKLGDESWKDFYSRVVYIIAEMFKKYQFLYIKGDFIKQYKLLKTYKGETMGMLECLLVEASKEGELELVKYALKNGANIHAQYEGALTWASFNDCQNKCDKCKRIGVEIVLVPCYQCWNLRIDFNFKINS